MNRCIKVLLLLCALAFHGTPQAQEDVLLKQLMQEDRPDTALLPPRIMPTQRMLWGEKGLLRVTKIAPLTVDQRKKEMEVRRFMLKAHQVLGFITLGGMAAQGVVGSQLYNGKYELDDLHEGLARGVNITYSTAAIMSLFAPPPLINRDKNLSSVKLHKWLALVHISGMIATNILGNRLEDDISLKPWHRAAAITTFASYGVAVLVIKF
jgi:hypothetical protein